MSIVVEHAGSSPETDAALALLLALGQDGQTPPQQAQPKSDPLADIMAQLAPLMQQPALSSNAPAPYPSSTDAPHGSYSVNGTVAPSYDIRPRREQPTCARYGGDRS